MSWPTNDMLPEMSHYREGEEGPWGLFYNGTVSQKSSMSEQIDECSMDTKNLVNSQ